MKEITVISGKGGTGKTTITAAFAGLCNAVLADCDVDASNLPLLLEPDIIQEELFTGSHVAVKDENQCTHCGECQKVCRFGAITNECDIVPVACEGCGACTVVCSRNALTLQEQTTGKVFVSQTRFGVLVHAELFMGEEASGKLVTRVRDVATALAEKEKKDILIDGSPGIGCPVIASIVGSTLVLLVCEPTLSSMFDLERIFNVVDHFNIPCCVCINKCDINMENTQKIESWCRQNRAPLVGTLPYDTRVYKAIVSKKTLTECAPDLSEKIVDMWEKMQKIL